MIIPNGVTLRVQNRKLLNRQLGSVVLNQLERERVHFRTTKELREALILESQGEIDFLEEIPVSVQELLALPEDTESPDVPSGGVLYRDEIEGLLGGGGGSQLEVLAADPTDQTTVVPGRVWMIDPPPADGKVIHFVTKSGVYQLTSTLRVTATAGE